MAHTGSPDTKVILHNNVAEVEAELEDAAILINEVEATAADEAGILGPSAVLRSIHPGKAIKLFSKTGELSLNMSNHGTECLRNWKIFATTLRNFTVRAD